MGNIVLRPCHGFLSSSSAAAKAIFEPWPLLEDSSRFHPVFTSLDFEIIFLHSKVVILESNHRPGGPGLCIYVPQRQGDPIIPPGTGFSSCRLLRLARRCSNRLHTVFTTFTASSFCDLPSSCLCTISNFMCRYRNSVF
jgi:hypothetical protein